MQREGTAERANDIENNDGCGNGSVRYKWVGMTLRYLVRPTHIRGILLLLGARKNLHLIVL
jgi:hypothetical protein